MRKLKHREIAVLRPAMLYDQGGKCLLCGDSLDAQDAVLDHCHTSGVIRGVLHRSCNALLGKIENNWRRYGFKSDRQLHGWARGLVPYLSTVARIPLEQRLLHPTFQTEDEKRERRNALARARRLKAKLSRVTTKDPA